MIVLEPVASLAGWVAANAFVVLGVVVEAHGLAVGDAGEAVCDFDFVHPGLAAETVGFFWP